MKTIVHIKTSDWEVVYSNGVMFAEGHNITPEEWFRLGQKHHNIKPESIARYYFEEEDEEHINFNFPESIHNIPKRLFNKKDSVENEDQ